DVAAHLEMSCDRKLHGDELSRRLLFRIEIELRRLDIDLVDELVVIAEFERIAGRNRNLRHGEGAAVLHDAMALRRYRHEAKGLDDGQTARADDQLPLGEVAEP